MCPKNSYLCLNVGRKAARRPSPGRRHIDESVSAVPMLKSGQFHLSGSDKRSRLPHIHRLYSGLAWGVVLSKGGSPDPSIVKREIPHAFALNINAMSGECVARKRLMMKNTDNRHEICGQIHKLHRDIPKNVWGNAGKFIHLPCRRSNPPATC